MRILLIGANGFIGRHLLVALRSAGHEVVAAVRRPDGLERMFPEVRAIRADMNRDLNSDVWQARLTGIDAVINCAGVMQGTGLQDIEAIHHLAPRALFEACARTGVRRVIQISAVSADPAAGTRYATSKHRGEEALRALDLDWVVLRPSLVYGAGSFGGTSLLRGLAGFPVIVPVVGDGDQPFQPLHVNDLAAQAVKLIERPQIARVTLEPVGPEVLTLEAILIAWRAWLGFGAARIVHVPRALVAAACRIGDLIGATSFNTSALEQLEYGNAGGGEDAAAVIGIQPRPMAQWLATRPAEVQDRWHARLVFLRPLLRLSLGALWIGSGIAGLFASPVLVAETGRLLGLGELAAAAGTAFSLLDLAIGVLVLYGWRPAVLGTIQIALVAGYTIALTLAIPALWMNLFGPLLKNLPVLAAVGVWMAIEPDR